MIHTLGVTPADLCAHMVGLTIGPSEAITVPIAEQIIQSCAAQVQGEAEAVGIDLSSLDDAQAPYHVCREIILYLSLARICAVTRRGEGSAWDNYYAQLARDQINTLRKHHHRIAPTSGGPDRFAAPVTPCLSLSRSVSGRATRKAIRGGL